MEAVDPITTRQRANSSWEDVAINLNTVAENAILSHKAASKDMVERIAAKVYSEAFTLTFRKVLDHGIVRLVDSMGSDLSVVRSARVSYDADWRAGDDAGSDKRLINYLIRNGHTSPFEHVVFTFEVKAPIFVLRQWMRHRTWSYNEVSARYTELPEEFYVPAPDKIGTQSKDNKQVRVIEEEPAWLDERGVMNDVLRIASFEAHATYKALLKMNCPRELARVVLPLNTYSHMFATVNLHNLLKFITQRCHAHAQYEIRVYAEAMLDLIKPIVPVCVEAYLESNRSGE